MYFIIFDHLCPKLLGRGTALRLKPCWIRSHLPPGISSCVAPIDLDELIEILEEPSLRTPAPTRARNESCCGMASSWNRTKLWCHVNPTLTITRPLLTTTQVKFHFLHVVHVRRKGQQHHLIRLGMKASPVAHRPTVKSRHWCFRLAPWLRILLESNHMERFTGPVETWTQTIQFVDFWKRVSWSLMEANIYHFWPENGVMVFPAWHGHMIDIRRHSYSWCPEGHAHTDRRPKVLLGLSGAAGRGVFDELSEALALLAIQPRRNVDRIWNQKNFAENCGTKTFKFQRLSVSCGLLWNWVRTPTTPAHQLLWRANFDTTPPQPQTLASSCTVARTRTFSSDER